MDIVAESSSPTEASIKVVFQCKRYFGRTTLGISAVDQTAGAIGRAAADEGVLVSTREPSDSATEAIKKWRHRGILIHWKSWCGKELAINLAEKTPSVLLQRFPELLSDLPISNEYESLCPSFEIVTPAVYPQSINADKFYDGYPPTWQDLKAKHDIDRIVYTRPYGIRKRILNFFVEKKGPKTVALLGLAGVGKTTLLRRAGFDSVSTGHLVLRLREDWRYLRLDLARQIIDVTKEANPPTLLVLIDDTSDLVFEEDIFERTIKELESLSSLVLLLAEHPDRWRVAKRKIPSLAEGENYFRFPIHHLLDSETEALVDRIMQYEQNHTLSHSYSTLSREECLNLCQDIADRQLLVAMLQMKHGMRFRKIIEREYERVPTQEGKDGYASVCYFNDRYGIALPILLLLRAFRLTTPSAVKQFQDITQGLFIENRLGLIARHIVIARAIARYALPTPETRKVALHTILSVLDFDDENEKNIFLQIFSGTNMHRRLVSQLHRQPDLVRALYRDLRASYEPTPPYFLKFLATSQSLSEHLLGDPMATRNFLEEAIQIDCNYVFAHRQYAWLEHREGNWKKAADRAEHAAKLAPTNFLCNYHCGLILSLNTIRNFRRAKDYLKRALELSPNDPKVTKKLEAYQTAEHILEYLLKDKNMDEFIPVDVLNELRPGLANSSYPSWDSVKGCHKAP